MTSELITHTLKGKRIVVGVCGGIAIYKTCELVRLLITSGAKVDVVMTKTATKMISPEVFSALSGSKTWFNQWQQNSAGEMPHIAVSRNSDAIIIAPATANTIAKIANGIADDLLTNLVLARCKTTPLFLAPAMNSQMWDNPASKRNLHQCENDNITIFTPQAGELACGEVGVGRMLEPSDLLMLLAKQLASKLLLNKKVLITLGPTSEKIDPVRVITNISSGKMGIAFAKAGWMLGADITVVAGGNIIPFINPQISSNKIKWINVVSANEMLNAVIDNINSTTFDFFIAAAAVSDYHVKNPATHKIKKENNVNTINLELSQNPDILKSVAKSEKFRPLIVVGFAAESENLEKNAQTKLTSKNLDYIVANDINIAFNNDNNAGFLLTSTKNKSQKIILEEQPKELFALNVFNLISRE